MADCAMNDSTKPLFSSLAHSREVLSLWQADYSTLRPLGSLTPSGYANRSAPYTQGDAALRGAARPVPLLHRELNSTYDSAHRG